MSAGVGFVPSLIPSSSEPSPASSHALSFPPSSLFTSLDFTWIDTNKRQIRLPAPTYIDYVFTWVQGLLDDENTFPTKTGELTLLPPLSLASYL
jgi:hypothetical protein